MVQFSIANSEMQVWLFVHLADVAVLRQDHFNSGLRAFQGVIEVLVSFIPTCWVPSFNLNRRWRSVCSEHVHTVCAVAGAAFAKPCTVHHPQKAALQEFNQSLTHSLTRLSRQLAMWRLE